MNNSLVSVITPVYNAVHYLPQVIQSVQSQRTVCVEHILVDDGSTDGSLALLKELSAGNSTIRIYSLAKNSGPIIARNFGIERATGRYIAFLDADDSWLPEKCSIQTAFMEKTGAAITFTDYRFVSADGTLIGRRLRGPSTVNWAIHHMTRYLGCLTVMIDRRKVPNFSIPNISPSVRAEDFLAWSHVIKTAGPARRVPFDLARYTVVPRSRSSNLLSNVKSVWLLYRRIEKINFLSAAVFMLFFLMFSSAKRILCRPRFDRKLIDPLWSPVTISSEE